MTSRPWGAAYRRLKTLNILGEVPTEGVLALGKYLPKGIWAYLALGRYLPKAFMTLGRHLPTDVRHIVVFPKKNAKKTRFAKL